MRRCILVLTLLCFLLTSTVMPHVSAQSDTRKIQFTVRLDYARLTPVFDGWVRTPDGSRPDLGAWGFTETLPSWYRVGFRQWNVRGTINTARITPADASGFYHFQIGSLALAPSDKLTLFLPFVNIDYARITPQPTNFHDLMQLNPNALASYLGLQFDGTGTPITLDIPFTPIRRDITLIVTPLLGEMLRGRSDGFRLSGRVVFDRVGYREFQGLCQTKPSPNFFYRSAALLFALDMPPALHAGLGNDAVYDNKPTHSSILFELETCHFTSGTGRVEGTFNGRALSSDRPSSSKEWTGTAESNRQFKTNGEDQAYILTLGDIALGPGDVLTVNIPGAEIRQVIERPDRFTYTRRDTQDIVYEGPRSPFALKIVYVPGSEMFYPQLPAMARARVQPVEEALQRTQLPETFDRQLPAMARAWVQSVKDALQWAQSSWLALGLGLVALALFIAAHRIRHGRSKCIVGGIGWSLAALALFYGLRGAFGLLVLAVLVYSSLYWQGPRTEAIRKALGAVHLPRALGSKAAGHHSYGLGQPLHAGLNPKLTNQPPSNSSGVRVVLALVLVVAAFTLDHYLEQILFSQLTKLELQTTPITALVLLVLEMMLAWLILAPRFGREPIFPRATLPVSLGLTAFILFDVLQKSLLALALLGIGIIYLLYRLPCTRDAMTDAEIKSRLVRAWKSRLIPLGIGILILFVAGHGLQSTRAVLGPHFGIFGTLIMSILLFISIVQHFLTIGLLFLILYPVLPFRIGYLKAVTFGVFLWLIFIAGLGADDRLLATLEPLIIGRFVYYLGVPLLIGLYFDVEQLLRSEQAQQVVAGQAIETLPFSQTASLTVRRAHRLIGVVGAIATLVAPEATAYVTGVPLVMTLFDLLEQLSKSAGS